MALNDAAVVLAANAIDGAIQYMQAHSGDPGAAGTANAIGSRVAVNGAVDADGDITWTNVAFTGLGAGVAVWGVSYWSAATAGTWYGNRQRDTGDTTANSAGEYTFTLIAENTTAS